MYFTFSLIESHTKADNTIQYNTIQYNTIQYNAMQCNTIQYNTIQYNTIQYNTIQYNTTIQYNPIIHFNTIQYNAMLVTKITKSQKYIYEFIPLHNVCTARLFPLPAPGVLEADNLPGDPEVVKKIRKYYQICLNESAHLIRGCVVATVVDLTYSY